MVERCTSTVVDVHADVAGTVFVVSPHHDAARVDVVDRAAAQRPEPPVPGIDATVRSDAGADQGLHPAAGRETAWRCMFEPMSARLARRARGTG